MTGGSLEIKITCRHMALTPAISEYVHRRFQRIQKYFHTINSVQVIITFEKHRKIAQSVLAVAGVTFRAREESIDLYAAIDLLVDKIDRMLKRRKEKMKNHHVKKVFRDALPAERKDYDVKQSGPIMVRTIPLDRAVEELSETGKKMMFFLDEQTQQLSVLEKNKNSFEVKNIIYE
ncbi:MAG: ribosome-associated translation inhibitor RaiA [Elusimicrobia bacterium]|nr:ribosome-associated translation inhibitor RaiA [Elusimicrobiota bacterium]